MAPKVKDRIINALIMFASGAGVALFMLFVTNKKLAATELREDVDSKVGITEFTEFKNENHKAHLKLEKDRKEDLKEITDHFDSRFEDFKDFMIELNKR
jgi:hypothetical protein